MNILDSLQENILPFRFSWELEYKECPRLGSLDSWPLHIASLCWISSALFWDVMTFTAPFGRFENPEWKRRFLCSSVATCHHRSNCRQLTLPKLRPQNNYVTILTNDVALFVLQNHVSLTRTRLGQKHEIWTRAFDWWWSWSRGATIPW